ncbi:hypothetical protein [Micromonospora sp. WMMD998]|uniref:hypothetical protein n=1 Tax=Micromonospora sp. WMMD998 TaxID=3016092 RepID=UPI00249B9109|nr:hypothetical protein [Micromonospora sp. WMMD998]WFE41576.1 hypothetical protein O7619_25215 [Micromonospora sp. WMMD998]
MTDAALCEVGSRARTQPPPPAVVFEALTDPDRDPARPWLALLDDEQPPRVLETAYPELVVWSSLWPRRPDARVRFELAPDGGAGTLLRWRLLMAEPLPDDSLLGHLRKRLNELINAELRHTFGQ